MSEDIDLKGICEICNVKAIKENDKLSSEFAIMEAGIEKIDNLLSLGGEYGDIYFLQKNTNGIAIYDGNTECVLYEASNLKELIMKIGEER